MSTLQQPSQAPADPRLSHDLERDGFLVASGSHFELAPGERVLLDAATPGRDRKNVSYDPTDGRLRAPAANAAQAPVLASLLARFSEWAALTTRELLPAYADALQCGRASFRPRRVGSRPASWRKDDRRLHLDAFPSLPVSGRRILRLFVNIDPEEPRVWQLGADFGSHASRFLAKARSLAPGEAALLQALRITKTRRTPYDQLMLQLHDRGKADEAYQRSMRLRTLAFDPGAVWLAFTDQAPHAVIAGRFLLEQTFYLPVDALHDEAASPLRRLEAMTGRRLV